MCSRRLSFLMTYLSCRGGAGRGTVRRRRRRATHVGRRQMLTQLQKEADGMSNEQLGSIIQRMEKLKVPPRVASLFWNESCREARVNAGALGGRFIDDPHHPADATK